MRALRALLLVAGAWLLCPAHAADSAAPIEQLSACVNALPAHLAPGITSLSARCPHLEQQLDALGVSAQLDPDWREHLTRQGLEQLVQLARRYAQAPSSSEPRTSALADILRPMRMPPVRTLSWWDRLKQRLLAWLQLSSAAKQTWLDKLLARVHVPLLLQKIILYAVLAALLGSAVWVLGREWRLLRATRGARRRTRSPVTLLTDSPTPLTLAQLERAQARDRPAVLLRLLVQALRQSGRLRTERALTHRELVQRSRWDDDTQRGRFAGLAALAERRLYGPASLMAAEEQSTSAQVLADARQLYAQLQDTPGGAR